MRRKINNLILSIVTLEKFIIVIHDASSLNIQLGTKTGAVSCKQALIGKLFNIFINIAYVFFFLKYIEL